MTKCIFEDYTPPKVIYKFEAHFEIDDDGAVRGSFPGGGWSGQSRVGLGRGSEMCAAIEAIIRLGRDLESKFMLESFEGGLEGYLDQEDYPRFPVSR